MIEQVLHLARWLGPWSTDPRGPESRVTRRTVTVMPGSSGEKSFDAWFYTPTTGRIKGVYILAPGLHYLGAADPRMKRLCTVLASAGIAAFCPFIPDYLDLLVTPVAIADFQRAFVTMLDLEEVTGHNPGVMSISFGSLLALRLASAPKLRERVGGALVFGGYCSWADTVRFCLTGEDRGGKTVERDLMNQPVAYMNLAQELRGMPSDGETVLEAWRRLVHSSWGRQEFKRGDCFLELAQDIALMLPENGREVFLAGAGKGDHSLAFEALGLGAQRLAYLDLEPWLKEVLCPVHLVHGVEDDVIPVSQMDELYEALCGVVDVTCHKTGLYSHTDSREFVEKLPILVSEVHTLMGMMSGLVSASSIR